MSIATQTATPFLKQQLITYMGNKRKLLTHIEGAMAYVQEALDGRPISFADTFSGSGVVSRLAITSVSNVEDTNMKRVKHLIANDLAHYAHISNQCYLREPDPETQAHIHSLIDQANALADICSDDYNGTNAYVAKYWAPQDDDNIQAGERCYFTQTNARRIDAIRDFIASERVPVALEPFLLAPLLAECSMHTNTNGQFAAFYKDEDGVGAFGGKKKIDCKRITQLITLPYPLWNGSVSGDGTVSLHRKDAQAWADDEAGNDTDIDLAYLDPPYNKHPYSIYYFLLDIIAIWDKTVDIPDSYRGQPKTWVKSPFNSTTCAKDALRKLITTIPAKFVALSYYDAGIISIADIDTMLADLGEVVQKTPIVHGVYNRLHGVGAYKRASTEHTTDETDATTTTTTTTTSHGTTSSGAKEYMWLLRKKR